MSSWQPLQASSKLLCPTKDCGGALLIVKRIGFCMKCKQGFERPKTVHKHKTEKEWEPEEIAKIVDVGLKDDPFKQLSIRTLFAIDLRRAELVGTDDPRVPEDRKNPGLRWENVRDDGIWVKRKMHQDMLFKKCPDLVKQLRDFFGPRKEGKIFERSTDWVRKTLQTGAKRAGFQDWDKIHPHSVRHTMTTWTARKHGVVVARDTADHTNIATTNRYVARTPAKELQTVSEEALALV